MLVMTYVNPRKHAPLCCFHRCWRLANQPPNPPEGATVRLDVATYQRVLGDEIRRLRKQRSWTRKDLNERLQSEISLQTLATYELGTRQVSVIRFVEICLALDE